MTQRRPTNQFGNRSDTSFNGGAPIVTGSAATRHCMSCNKWRSLAGGRIHPRTRLWQCSCCTALGLARAGESTA